MEQPNNSLQEAAGSDLAQQPNGQLQVTTQNKSSKRICANCEKPIVHENSKNQSALKALGKYYHEDCFTCNDCGKLLKPKYFPFKDAKSGTTLLLCQYDYFKRHDLLCNVCDKPLRGLYYTAFGRRYDVEHFSCKICGEACGVKKCFMFKDQLYCRYHFLKFFSTRCKGCEYPISDQYIEFPRGDEIHCWHPECYGIHKYWHVILSAESMGLSSLPKNEYDETLALPETKPTKEEMETQIQALNSMLSKIWSIMYRFEEETASCISDMFQYLASSDQMKGINSAALFVLKVECLFKALNSLDIFVGRKNDTEDSGKSLDKGALDCNKFSKSLSTKIMIYLQLLRKLGTSTLDKDIELSSFMSIITGLAHFLKLLCRYGLNSALAQNSSTGSVIPLMKFLREVKRNELYQSNPFDDINLPITITDNCASCGKYIQEECIQYQHYRWHLKCFACSSCGKALGVQELTDCTFNKSTHAICCSNCSVEDPLSFQGFRFVPRLSQLIFLLKIALVRSKAVTEAQVRNKSISKGGGSDKSSMLTQETYVRTLNDITRLKTRRESMRISHKEQHARKSLILETAETGVGEASPDPNKNLVVQTNPHPKGENDKSGNNNDYSNVFSGTRSLTLDDISRIVAAEQARELRPNAFKHFKNINESDEESVKIVTKNSGIYYSELKSNELALLRLISLSLLFQDKNFAKQQEKLSNLIPSITKAEKSSSSNSFWFKMKFMRNKDTKKTNSSKVFGTPLEEACTKWGILSDLSVGPARIQIPIIVHELISTLRQMDMSVEGIFRKNGNIRKLRELSEQIDSNPTNMPGISGENAIQLSALLKKYIRALPDPMMMGALYDLWITAAKIESDFEKQKCMSLIYTLLPQCNRNVLEVMLSFLYWTSSFSHIENAMGSKMDIHNLSTVITPNILYEPNKNGTAVDNVEAGEGYHSTYMDAFHENEGENYLLAIEVVDFLITRNEDMAMVPKFLLNLLRDIQSQKFDSFPSIRDFVVAKLRGGNIEFGIQQEKIIEQKVMMVHSTSVVSENHKA